MSFSFGVSQRHVTLPAEHRVTTMTLWRRATTMTSCNTNSRSGHSSPSVTGDVTIKAGRQIVRATVVHMYYGAEKLVIQVIHSVLLFLFFLILRQLKGTFIIFFLAVQYNRDLRLSCLKRIQEILRVAVFKFYYFRNLLLERFEIPV